jgi:hypothetical protein
LRRKHTRLKDIILSEKDKETDRDSETESIYPTPVRPKYIMNKMQRERRGDRYIK